MNRGHSLLRVLLFNSPSLLVGSAPDGPHGEGSRSLRPAPGTLTPEVRTPTTTAVLSPIVEIGLFLQQMLLSNTSSIDLR